MMRDQFYPGARRRVMVLPRGIVVFGQLLKMGADLVDRGGHAVLAHGAERQLHVLRVPELLV
jgi:hypothetical protein